MINKIKYIIIFFLIGGCSSIEFTYKNDLINSPLDNNIQILIKGDDKSIISREVKSSFNEKEGADFVLEITSKKTQKNQTINTDGTASKILITHSLKYYLKNTAYECNILEKNISSSSTFDSKSAGYNFGTDVSAKELLIENITRNIADFINYLDQIDDSQIVTKQF